MTPAITSHGGDHAGALRQAVGGTDDPAGAALNVTFASIPGMSARSALRQRTSVRSVRDAGSSAPAVVATVPTNVRGPYSATRICVA